MELFDFKPGRKFLAKGTSESIYEIHKMDGCRILLKYVEGKNKKRRLKGFVATNIKNLMNQIERWL